MSYLDDFEYDDEDALLEAKAPQLDGGRTPDNSVANPPMRAPEEAANPQPLSIPPPARVSVPKPSVAQFIQQRKAPAVDPLMAQYQDQQAELDSLRQAKLGADYSSNMNQAFAQLAQGTNKPEANPVFNKIAAQNQSLLESKEKDADRQRKLVDSIGRRDLMKAYRTSTQAKQDQTREDKITQQAKLSDAQTKDVEQFNNNVSSMKEILNSVGDHSEWVGPLDSINPDLTANKDEVALRQLVGVMEDQYRHLITGAGAGSQELRRLAGRLPKMSDSLQNFKTKAQTFIDSVERAKGTYLNTVGAQGKDVTAFRSAAAPQSQPSKTGQGTPGDLVRDKKTGKLYTVGQDGDSLEELKP